MTSINFKVSVIHGLKSYASAISVQFYIGFVCKHCTKMNFKYFAIYLNAKTEHLFLTAYNSSSVLFHATSGCALAVVNPIQ